MTNAGEAADRQLGDTHTSRACATCPFQIRLEHRSSYTALPRYSQQEWVAAQEFIFLIGRDRDKKDRVLSVRIAEPTDASVTWEVTPLGKHSGTIKNATGTGNRFDYTPTVTQTERPITGTKKRNPPVAYRIKATVTFNGKIQEKIETVSQDERDIIRQEYVDFRTWKSGFELHVPYRNHIVEASRADFLQHATYRLVLDSAMTDLVNGVEANLGVPVHINSGWRNPRRNVAVRGKTNSNHQHGGAVDMKPSSLDGGAAARRNAYLNLYNAALKVSSRAVLIEKGAKQLYPGKAAIPLPSQTQKDNNNDGIPDTAAHEERRIESIFDSMTHVHIDRSPPDESEDD